MRLPRIFDLPSPREPFVEQRRDKRREPRSVVLVTQFSNRFGLCWIRVNRAADLLQPQPVGHRQPDLGNHVASMTSDNGRPDNLISAFLRMDFDETFVIAIQNRAIDVGKLLNVCVDFDPFFIGLMFVDSDMGNLR